MSPNVAYIISLSFTVLVFAALWFASLKVVNFVGNAFNLGHKKREILAFGAGFFFYKVLLTSWLMPWITNFFGE